MCCARGTRPRTSGNAEAAFPALDRLIADDGNLGIDEGNRIALAAAVGIEHRHENRRPSCTCGAASPTPEYSYIVSIMLSMNCWTVAFLSSVLSTVRALARRTGWPIRATFRIDMNEFYTQGLGA